MKLFTVGPVEMYSDSLEVGGNQLPYFRTNEFSEIMLEIEKNFLTLMQAPEKSNLVILTTSGTGAMEVAVMNAMTKEDKALVISGGGFGKRFAEICEIHSIPYDELKLEFGETLTRDRLEEYSNQGYTALMVNIHETSTGQLYDAKMLGDFCKKNNMLYIVDAISSFLADEFNMEEIGADLVITASQKALALAPGLAFIVVNERMKKIISENHVASLYFDMKRYFLDMERGQTPFTPAVGIVLQLQKRLEILTEKGIEKSISEHAERADYFRRLCEENNIKVLDVPLSNALTPIYFPENNAKTVFETLKNTREIMLTPNGGELSGKILRVGHLGNLKLEDYDNVISNLKEVL